MYTCLGPHLTQKQPRCADCYSYHQPAVMNKKKHWHMDSLFWLTCPAQRTVNTTRSRSVAFSPFQALVLVHHPKILVFLVYHAYISNARLSSNSPPPSHRVRRSPKSLRLLTNKSDFPMRPSRRCLPHVSFVSRFGTPKRR